MSISRYYLTESFGYFDKNLNNCIELVTSNISYVIFFSYYNLKLFQMNYSFFTKKIFYSRNTAARIILVSDKKYFLFDFLCHLYAIVWTRKKNPLALHTNRIFAQCVIISEQRNITKYQQHTCKRFNTKLYKKSFL